MFAFEVHAVVHATLPHSGVVGHVLAAGVVPSSHNAVEHVTVPGVPVPAAVPHAMTQSVASAAIQSPATRVWTFSYGQPVPCSGATCVANVMRRAAGLRGEDGTA